MPLPTKPSYHHAARVALVKCRDLHWAMMARREQRDTSLASLRMLIVADGANPCEYFIKSSFVRLGLIKQHGGWDFWNVLCPRVGVLLRCLPERVSISRPEAWGHLSLCQLPWSHDGGHSQVRCSFNLFLIWWIEQFSNKIENSSIDLPFLHFI